MSQATEAWTRHENERLRREREARGRKLQLGNIVENGQMYSLVAHFVDNDVTLERIPIEWPASKLKAPPPEWNIAMSAPGFVRKDGRYFSHGGSSNRATYAHEMLAIDHARFGYEQAVKRGYAIQNAPQG